MSHDNTSLATYATFKPIALAATSVFYCVWSSGYNAYCRSHGTVLQCRISSSADIIDFETNIKPSATLAVSDDDAISTLVAPFWYTGSFNDPALIRRFGQLTATSASEVLLYPRTYVEPASEGQRSIVSTSVTDSNGAGTGARQVRITYLNSAYVLKTEDVFTNGTTGVNTVATDIRFIESMDVVAGTAAVGAVKLMTGLAGAGTEIAGIGAGTAQSFFCHHYVPAGRSCYVTGWEGSVSDDVNFKLNIQERLNGTNLVDKIADLINVTGITAGALAVFGPKDIKGVKVPEKTYIRVTVVPGQATSTIVRGSMCFVQS